MLHSETLKDGTYEVRHDDDGNAIHVYIVDGTATIFETLEDLFAYVYLAQRTMKSKVIPEGDLFDLYESEYYDYESIFEDTNN